MKILVLNGSPRFHGNTKTALNCIIDGISKNIKSAEIDFIDIHNQKLSPCTNCDACKNNGGFCITPDDSAKIIDLIYHADLVIFGTPVYWWGISAQLKMVLDKFYSRDAQFHEQKKNFAIVAVGAAELDDPQYRLIREQFNCICQYLGWNLLFSESISAMNIDDLAKDENRKQELTDIWRKII